MARSPRRGERAFDGVLVIDKPAGMTSHDVVAVVRRVVGQRRVGHTGTLDPGATGVLVCCLGRATRLVPYLQAGSKTYAATMVLGRVTTSQDADGEVVATADASHVDEEAFCAALQRYVGAIEQIPPMVSAVKVGGERLHHKARRGEVVEREPRQVTIHDLVLEEWEPGPQATASFLVTCSAGTYVRTLAHDLGADLGVGGSLVSLRRLANGAFTTADALALDEVEAQGRDGTLDEVLLSLPAAVAGLPKVVVKEFGVVLGLTQGKPLALQGHEGPYAVTTGDQLVGIYRDERGAGRPQAVFLQPDDLGAVASRAPTTD